MKNTRIRSLAIGMTLFLAFASSASLAGPYKVHDKHFAWVNNFNDPENKIQGTFPDSKIPSLEVTFDYTVNNLYGYPAIVRGWHYGWNPAEDNTLPRRVSTIKSIPATFTYSSQGERLTGDFAYDIFLRKDRLKKKPEVEVMIWGGHNSWPLGKPTAYKVISEGGYTFDLWEGYNEGAGYYVYTFIPADTAGNKTLPSNGKLNVDIKRFLNWLAVNRSKDGYYSENSFLHALEAGFEVVNGKGKVRFQAKFPIQ